MIWRLIESFNDNLPLLLLLAIGLAFAAGGLPPMLERRRRRSIEGALPGFVEALSDGVGAGLGLQEVMSALQAFAICLSSFDNKLACE